MLQSDEKERSVKPPVPFDIPARALINYDPNLILLQHLLLVPTMSNEWPRDLLMLLSSYATPHSLIVCGNNRPIFHSYTPMPTLLCVFILGGYNNDYQDQSLHLSYHHCYHTH
jgi:hypothetical protein